MAGPYFNRQVGLVPRRGTSLTLPLLQGYIACLAILDSSSLPLLQGCIVCLAILAPSPATGMHRLPSYRRLLPHGPEGQVLGGGLKENQAIRQIGLVRKVSIDWRAGRLLPARLLGSMTFWGHVV